MRNTTAVQIFSRNPWGSVVRAALFGLVAFVLLSGVVPTSDSRPYFRGHQWLLAALCSVVIVFLLYCAVAGLRSRRER